MSDGQAMLTTQEAHYLGRIAKGASLRRIAIEDGVSIQAIGLSLDSAMAKLSAVNLMEAVTKAIRQDLLPAVD